MCCRRLQAFAGCGSGYPNIDFVQNPFVLDLEIQSVFHSCMVDASKPKHVSRSVCKTVLRMSAYVHKQRGTNEEAELAGDTVRVFTHSAPAELSKISKLSRGCSLPVVLGTQKSLKKKIDVLCTY